MRSLYFRAVKWARWMPIVAKQYADGEPCKKKEAAIDVGYGKIALRGGEYTALHKELPQTRH